MFYLKDSNLKYIFINNALAMFLKKTKEEVFGNKDTELNIDYFNANPNFTDKLVKEKLESCTYTIEVNSKTYEIHKFPVKLEFEKVGVAAFIHEIKCE